MHQLLLWLESTGLARTVGESLPVTAWLSAAHALSYTLTMSAGLIFNLHASGLVFPAARSETIARVAVRLLVPGLTVSVLTGFALFTPRASYTALGGVFQLKMALLLAAAAFQLTFMARLLRRPLMAVGLLRAGGALGAALWIALAVTACWFILFE
jgi:hypothetical protein